MATSSAERSNGLRLNRRASFFLFASKARSPTTSPPPSSFPSLYLTFEHGSPHWFVRLSLSRRLEGELSSPPFFSFLSLDRCLRPYSRILPGHPRSRDRSSYHRQACCFVRPFRHRLFSCQRVSATLITLSPPFFNQPRQSGSRGLDRAWDDWRACSSFSRRKTCHPQVHAGSSRRSWLQGCPHRRRCWSFVDGSSASSVEPRAKTLTSLFFCETSGKPSS